MKCAKGLSSSVREETTVQSPQPVLCMRPLLVSVLLRFLTGCLTWFSDLAGIGLEGLGFRV